MAKILSQAGISLADLYNVEGSIAGIETLLSQDVSLVHELGNVLFSERFSTVIRRSATGDLLQSATFDIVLSDLPAVPFRILNIQAIADTAARLNHATVFQRDVGAAREIPIWAFDDTTGVEWTIRMADEAAATGLTYLSPTASFTPGMGGGNNQPQSVEAISIRGLTTAFGAGDVEYIFFIMIAFAQVGGINSKGLPIPGW